MLLRRFSAKEERRRLTASWFLRAEESRPYLALENHLNYVYHADRELTVEEVYGLTALFNSALAGSVLPHHQRQHAGQRH